MANLLREVCHDVKVEPQLQKVNEGDCLNLKTVTGDQARFDVFARGVWTPFDIRVFTLEQDKNSSSRETNFIEREEGLIHPSCISHNWRHGMSKECI